MGWIDDIRASSMNSVVNEDAAYSLRFVFRWYSRTFATPLHVVEGLPLEEVLRTYYEVRYEEMEEAERTLEIERIIEPKADLQKRRKEEDSEEAELLEYAQKVEEENKIELSKPPPAPIDTKVAGVSQAILDASKAVRVLQSDLEKANTPKIEPNINMKFIDTDEEFDALLERSAFGPKTK